MPICIKKNINKLLPSDADDITAVMKLRKYLHNQFSLEAGSTPSEMTDILILFSKISDEKELRIKLRPALQNYYRAFSNTREQQDKRDSAAGYAAGSDYMTQIIYQQIAFALAHIYYKNFNVTADDVVQVLWDIEKRFPDCNLEKLDARAILNQRIDGGKMSLITILPNIRNIEQGRFRAAVRLRFTDQLNYLFHKLKNAILSNISARAEVSDVDGLYEQNLRAVAASSLDKYISNWKFSIFGHHHDERARQVRAQIMHPKVKIQAIPLMLADQVKFVCVGEHKKAANTQSHGVMRWFGEYAKNKGYCIDHVEKDRPQSGYLAAVEEAIEVFRPLAR